MSGDSTYTVAELCCTVLGRSLPAIRRSMKSIPAWPPDVFAICASILRESGAYIRTVTNWPPKEMRSFSKNVGHLGSRWVKSYRDAKGCRPPKQIRKWWSIIESNLATPIRDVEQREDLWKALVLLVAASDEACWGVGMPGYDQPLSDFEQECAFRLFENKPSSLCRSISPQRAVVLPKSHVPQGGITLRSLTHNLCLCPRGEIHVRWRIGSLAQTPSGLRGADHGINVLLLPWPHQVQPLQFSPAQPKSHGLRRPAQGYDFFDYDRGPKRPAEDVLQDIRNAVTAAKSSVEVIDGIVLPEGALHVDDVEPIAARLVQDGLFFLVAGAQSPAKPSEQAQNGAFIACLMREIGTKKLVTMMTQPKQHRWLLDERQIRRYGIGGRLDPQKRWWENIKLGRREMNILVVKPSLTIAVLICEDLARPDPAGDILRAVGPNLVIALLQDGPQRAHRWPALNAAVLADDPGSSVLTLTSIGMATMGAGADGTSACRSIALWKERGCDVREIWLPPNAQGVVLSLTQAYEKEWTADGRDDGGTTSACVRLAGVHPVFTG